MSEIIWIHIGQTGVQIGLQFWDLIMKEHGVGYDGQLQHIIGNPHVMFDEDEKGIFIPRAVFADTDDFTIEEAMKTDLGQLLNSNQFWYGRGAANNYAAGFFSWGRTIIDELSDWIKIQIEKWTKLDAIVIFHSMSGGTGTGFWSLLCSRLPYLFNCLIITVMVMPSGDSSSWVIEPYNFVFSLNSFAENTDCNICYDNKSLYRIWQDKLKIESPNLYDINRLIWTHISSVLSSIRFNVSNSFNDEKYEVELNGDFYTVNCRKLVSSLVPFTRMQFMSTSFSPFISDADLYKTDTSVDAITNSVLESDSYTVVIRKIKQRSLGAMLNYRGQIAYSDIVKTLEDVRSNLRTVEFVPTGVLWSLTNSPLVNSEDEHLTGRSVSLIITQHQLPTYFQLFEGSTINYLAKGHSSISFGMKVSQMHRPTKTEIK